MRKILTFLWCLALALFSGLDVRADDELRCLALNVYFEAGNQPEAGMEAVAHVTINRREAKEYPSSICDVVYQRRQFSWTHDGRSDEPRDAEAWVQSKVVAWRVYTNRTYLKPDPTDGSLWYHADYVRPVWRTGLKRYAKIGSHIFYLKK